MTTPTESKARRTQTARSGLLAGPFALTAVALAASSIIACGDTPPPPKTADAVKPTPMAAPPSNNLPPQPPDSPTASAVHISEEITSACGIAAPDAFFAFDSAHVRQSEDNVLNQVATCFKTGPLKGRSVKLVGHADPRGGSDYNMTLGQSRADSVAQYLVGKGMDKAKTESSSRGAMDATGGDEPSWARDRRVDMMLGQ
jgi:peptidoglycan-associated lipoprotein